MSTCEKFLGGLEPIVVQLRDISRVLEGFAAKDIQPFRWNCPQAGTGYEPDLYSVT